MSAVRSETDQLGRVVLAIATFQANDSVIRLLDEVFGSGDSPFGSVIVVDSLGTPQLFDEIRRRGWRVEYENSPLNLGSAGNLARRLELAAACDADWCYALNHDGHVDLDAIRELVRTANGYDRVGAVYPTRYRPNRGGTWEAGQRTMLPLPSVPLKDRPEGKGDELTWSSSNGALYNLAPIRSGLRVWWDLWMGWEDLGYGWLLHRNGWRQLRSANADFIDNYEYRGVRLPGYTLWITEKPPWYSYYQFRNLILICRRTGRGFVGYVGISLRIFQELVLTTIFRGDRMYRYGLLWRGIRDGIRDRAGRGPVP